MIQVSSRIQIRSEGLDKHVIILDGVVRDGVYTTMGEVIDAIEKIRAGLKKKIPVRAMGANTTFFADKIHADAREASRVQRQWVAHSVYSYDKIVEKNRERRVKRSDDLTPQSIEDLFDKRGG